MPLTEVFDLTANRTFVVGTMNTEGTSMNLGVGVTAPGTVIRYTPGQNTYFYFNTYFNGTWGVKTREDPRDLDWSKDYEE